jgi:3-methylcrotonyl-CoA carboxylase alpha subunit
MIAKLIADAGTREEAIETLTSACERVVVEEPKTNAWFLARLLEQPEFRSGQVSTNLIAAHQDELCDPPQPSEALVEEAGGRFIVHDDFMAGDASDNAFIRDRGLIGFRLNAPESMKVRLRLGGESIEVTVSKHHWAELSTTSVGQSWLGQQITLHENGAAFRFTPDASRGSGTAHGLHDGEIEAPMPGKVTAVDVSAGDKVAMGQRLLTLEAMKMEHALTAPFDGTVAEVNAKAGAQVTEGQMLVKVEPIGSPAEAGAQGSA